MAQFCDWLGYYILGGPYAAADGRNVRQLDLFLCRSLTPRKKGAAEPDCTLLLFLLRLSGAFLLWGGYRYSTMYSFKYGGERSPTAWRPYIVGPRQSDHVQSAITLMLLQAVL